MRIALINAVAVGELSEAHKRHLLPQFAADESLDEEQTIEILTDQITKVPSRSAT